MTYIRNGVEYTTVKLTCRICGKEYDEEVKLDDVDDFLAEAGEYEATEAECPKCIEAEMGAETQYWANKEEAEYAEWLDKEHGND